MNRYSKFTIAHEPTRGRFPWAVYRVVPLGLISPGRMWVVAYQSRAEAEDFVDAHTPKSAAEWELEAEKYIDRGQQ